MPRKPKTITPDLEKKSGKMWLEIQRGKTPAEAARAVGIDPTNASHAIQTKNYQALEHSSFKEEILKHILMPQIAEEHVKLINQDTDRGVKLAAIKLAYDKIEPEGAITTEKEKIIVVLKD
jgi:hypothetical protein